MEENDSRKRNKRSLNQSKDTSKNATDTSSTGSMKTRTGIGKIVSSVGSLVSQAANGSTNKKPTKRPANDDLNPTSKKRIELQPRTPTPQPADTNRKSLDTVGYEPEDEEMDTDSDFNHDGKEDYNSITSTIQLSEESVIKNVAHSFKDAYKFLYVAKTQGLNDLATHGPRDLINLASSVFNLFGFKSPEDTIREEIKLLSKKMDSIEQALSQDKKMILETITQETKELKSNMKEMTTMVNESELRINKRLEWIEGIIKKTNSSQPQTATAQMPNHQKHTPTPINIGPSNKISTPEPTTKVHQNPRKAHHPSRAVLSFEGGIPIPERLEPEEICRRLNTGLNRIGQNQIRVVAAKYTQHGNIVVNTREDQKASELVKHASKVIECIHPGHPVMAREDIKWWKIQIDGIPTRRLNTDGTTYYYTEGEVHNELIDANPVYSQLDKHIIYKPRWLRPAAERMKIRHSSAVLALDNEDAAKQILKANALAAFGRFCTLRPFQERPPVIQCKNCWGWDHKENACRVKTRCRICSEAHHEQEHEPRPCARCEDQMTTNGDSIINEDCMHRNKCSNCALSGIEEWHHPADYRRCPARLRKWGSARTTEKKALEEDQPWQVVVRKKKTTKPRNQKSGNKNSTVKTTNAPSDSNFINTFTPLQPTQSTTTLENTQQ
ncbi:hypothetical protein CVT24_007443 [Panaeolus cyanescens]|uniref:Uncharacterized protein n=1 Tax=Panaeolus cyanescens TaxID=181874 RepID=A0A409W505_9AGAR|nr:hypothetical protein CVT24_007443 [Panaeolus cyanescens]